MIAVDALKKFFPVGTAEGERSILEKVFILPEQMADILSIQHGSPRLVVGNKGVGKTAIFDYISNCMNKNNVPAILLRPDDFSFDTPMIETDIGSLKKRMYGSLLMAVKDKLVEFGLLDATSKLKTAPKIIGAMNSIASRVDDETRESIINAFADSNSSAKRQMVASALDTYFLMDGAIFVVMIDDTDQVASTDIPNHLNRIWGLLLAARQLAMKVTSLRLLISLRSEIWRRLQRDEHGQRDQVDHFRPLVVDLRGDEHYLERIFDRRIEMSARALQLNNADSISIFFDSSEVILPTSTETRSWRAFVTKSSRERPRDLIQLVSKLADFAKRQNRKKITSQDAERSMHEFSAERVSDISTEVGIECPNFKEVVRTFQLMDFEVAFETLRAHLEDIPTRFSVQVRGKTLQSRNRESMLLLLELLFEAGFINARITDTRRPREFRHVTHADDPQLVRASRWPDLQASRWEIHPAFRTFLLDLKQEHAYR